MIDIFLYNLIMGEDISIIDQEMMGIILSECQDNLAQFVDDLTKLNDAPDKEKNELINALFRSVHSIKGSAGFIELTRVSELSHAMETLLGRARENKLTLTEEHLSLIFKGQELLSLMLESHDNIEPDGFCDLVSNFHLYTETTDSGSTVGEIREQNILDNFSINNETLATLKKKFQYIYQLNATPQVDLVQKNLTLIEFLDNLRTLGSIEACQPPIDAILDVSTQPTSIQILYGTPLDPSLIQTATSLSPQQIFYLSSPPPDNAESSDQTTAGTANHNTPQKIIMEEQLKIPVSQINHLYKLIEMLTITRNQLLSTAQSFTKIEPLMKTLNNITTDLQHDILKTRLQPLSPVFSKIPWMIRDLSKRLNKLIDMEITGDQQELDKKITENLSDPITHLIRNIVDHAIELPEERLAAGKKAEGRVQINAYQEGGYAYIDIIDDGRGIDSDIISRKALEKSLITEQQLGKMTPQEKLRLIFLPGFSTKEQVSDISGRGVGMDVVQNNIERLHGEIEVISTVGQGTTMRLKLPLSASIIPGFIVKTGNNLFIIPQANITKIIRISAKDQPQYTVMDNGAEMLRYGGYYLPYTHLGKTLHIDTSNEKNEILLMIIKSGKNQFAVEVDDILGKEDIVAKPKAVNLCELTWFSGSTLLGDGQIAFILDMQDIAKKAEILFDDKPQNTCRSDEIMIKNHCYQGDYFVFFDIGTPTIYSVPLVSLFRIEKIPETMLAAPQYPDFITINQINYQLILPEFIFEMQEPMSDIIRNTVLIPKFQATPIAILINQIKEIQYFTPLDFTLTGNQVVFAKSHGENNLIHYVDFSSKISILPAQPQIAKLLIMESSPYWANLVRNYLSEINLDIVHMEYGQDAYSFIEKTQPDVILTAMELMDMSGIDFASTINYKYAQHKIPLIAMLSERDEKYMRMKNFSAFNSSVKKANKQELVSEIQKVFIHG